jgi:hypothetical protein
VTKKLSVSLCAFSCAASENRTLAQKTRLPHQSSRTP